MPFDLTVNKQGKGHNGDPGPMSSNDYIMIGGGDTGQYFLRGGQVYDSTGILVEPPYPESVYKALENMSNEALLGVGFEVNPAKVDRPAPPAGGGVDFTAGPGATPMQLNAPKPGRPDTGKAEPVPQGTEVPVPERGQRSFVSPTQDAANKQADLRRDEERRLHQQDVANEAHAAKVEAARRSGAKIDPSLLKK